MELICQVNNLNVTSLRYFNAAGAHESGEIGEAHQPETHLIPSIFDLFTVSITESSCS